MFSSQVRAKRESIIVAVTTSRFSVPYIETMRRRRKILFLFLFFIPPVSAAGQVQAHEAAAQAWEAAVTVHMDVTEAWAAAR